MAAFPKQCEHALVLYTKARSSVPETMSLHAPEFEGAMFVFRECYICDYVWTARIVKNILQCISLLNSSIKKFRKFFRAFIIFPFYGFYTYVARNTG